MTIRVALIGAGVMGNAHSDAYARIPDARVVAVIDVDAGRARKIALAHGASAYPSVAEMCADERIDMVDICTPTCAHKELVIQCADRGLHVLVEKPIAHTLEDARSGLIERSE